MEFQFWPAVLAGLVVVATKEGLVGVGVQVM